MLKALNCIYKPMIKYRSKHLHCQTRRETESCYVKPKESELRYSIFIYLCCFKRCCTASVTRLSGLLVESWRRQPADQSEFLFMRAAGLFDVARLQCRQLRCCVASHTVYSGCYCATIYKCIVLYGKWIKYSLLHHQLLPELRWKRYLSYSRI